MKGPLIIVSGPSGAGKSTVVKRLLETSSLPLRQAVTVTTRAPRQGEVDGVHYHFWTREKFEQHERAGDFLEHATVFDNRYGTLLSEVDQYRVQGKGVILVIDVQGAATVRTKCPDAVSIFLKAPSPEEYERRIRLRHTEDEAAIQRRLAEALAEEARAGEYDYVIPSETVERTVTELQARIQDQFKRGNHAG
jgi:guanylate kinase